MENKNPISITSYVVIGLNFCLLIFNIYMINEGYDYTHVPDIYKRDGQYGMVYGFYGIAHVLNVIVGAVFVMILLLKRKTQKLDLFRFAMGFIIFNELVIAIGWGFLD